MAARCTRDFGRILSGLQGPEKLPSQSWGAFEVRDAPDVARAAVVPGSPGQKFYPGTILSVQHAEYDLPQGHNEAGRYLRCKQSLRESDGNAQAAKEAGLSLHAGAVT